MRDIKNIMICVLVILVVVIYNIYDNNRIQVVNQTVEIHNLPDTFDDFTILQITDLHGKYFGENQEKLVSEINSVDYDMIAITGDIQNQHEDNIDAFLNMMKNIKNKDNVFFVMGNGDDEKFRKAIEDSGCNMLDSPYEFRIGDDSLWINEFVFTENFEGEGVKIGLTHIPIESDRGYDLVISGHYHGGQYRIPIWGAFFIPNVNGGGILPSQGEVSGLIQRNGYVEYVSRGLGANNSIRALQFRLFNTPEINVIKLIK